MVTHTARRDVFQAIADPNRRAILGLLAQNRLTINAVADRFSVSRPAISKHMKILQECGLVEVEQQGRERYCVARIDRLSEVTEWIEQSRKMWNERFDALEIYLAELMASEAQAQSPEMPGGDLQAPKEGKVLHGKSSEQYAQNIITPSSKKPAAKRKKAGSNENLNSAGDSPTT